MKQPTEADFDVAIAGGYAVAAFRPTGSRYSYGFLLDGGDIREFGPLYPNPEIVHAGPTGDTGDYDPDRVLKMARKLALAAAWAMRKKRSPAR